MNKHIIILLAFLFPLLTGCEDTDIQLATEAGLDAFTAITLSHEEIQNLAKRSAAYMDSENQVAPPGNHYAKRLKKIVGNNLSTAHYSFNYKVYLEDTVNAFAMADGTIRIYSGLMDMLNDGELRFVVGHEMGHVVKDHIRQKMQMALAASAIRKGVASQNNALGDLARSQLGGFAELLLGAQFSQLEEKVADDYGLNFLRRQDYPLQHAVSALQKLSSLGADHSFLSSHPDPGKRAKRLELQIQGKALPIEETQQNIYSRVKLFIQQCVNFISTKLRQIIALL